MQTKESAASRAHTPPGSPDVPAPEPVTPPHEPVTPPGEPVTPPGEPVVPPSEPLAHGGQESLYLRKRLAAVNARIHELARASLDLRADSERLLRRTHDEVACAEQMAIKGFAEALMPVLDSLEAALRVNACSVTAYREGVELSLKQIAAAFERKLLVEINPLRGMHFDPALHQAISVMPAGQEADTIVHVLQKGYMIDDRLLRPALVTVAR